MNIKFLSGFGRYQTDNPESPKAKPFNGKVFTLSSSDPLYSQYAHDAFNIFVICLNNGSRKATMLNAGNNWLSVEGMPCNNYQQRGYRERKQ